MSVLKEKWQSTRKALLSDKKLPEVNWFVFSLALVFVIIFLIVPVLPGFFDTSQQGRLLFGYYHGRPIEYYQGGRMEYWIQEQWKLLESNVPNADGSQLFYDAWYLGFNAYALEMAQEDYIKRQGMNLSNARLFAEIKKSNSYIGPNGEFDRQIYERTDSTKRAEIENELRVRLLGERAINTVLTVTSDDAEILYDWLSPMASWQRFVSVLKVSAENLPNSAWQSYLENYPDLFKRITLRQMSFPSFAEAQKALKRLENGEDFASLASELSLDAFRYVGGERSSVYYYQLDQEWNQQETLKALFSLQDVGARSSILSLGSSGQWGIFEILQPASSLDLNEKEQRQELLSYVQRFDQMWLEKTLQEYALASIEEGNIENLLRDPFWLNFQLSASPLFYSANLGSLSAFSADEDFFRQVFTQELQTWGPAFYRDSELYLIRVLQEERENADALEKNSMKQISRFAHQNLWRSSLLDPSYFEDDFDAAFRRYFSSGR